MKTKIFKQTDKSPIGTSLIGYHESSYKDLVKILGEPKENCGDEYKVSTEWVIEDEKGNVFTIYDYKQTNLYDPSYESIEEFRNQESSEWHIGGHDEKHKDALIEFLNSNKPKRDHSATVKKAWREIQEAKI